MKDKEIQKLIREEEKRQKETLNLIASENYISKDVCEALGSVFTNKYAEGYPSARYYAGNAIVDKLEKLTQSRALKLFIRRPADRRKWSVNVQPYSGSPANLAVLHALVPKGEKIMGMALDMGGHLTHGYPASVTGKLWKQVPYGVDEGTETIDYNALVKLAKKEKPKLIIAGGSAYSRIIDFKKFRKIADAVRAPLLVDMSHFAGLVAGGVYPSPFLYADVVTTTTHKTLRGPRAAIIFARKLQISSAKSQINSNNRNFKSKRQTIAEAIDRSVFPGLQGGPHLNTIAGIAVALEEARKPAFKKYATQVIRNTRVFSDELARLGWRIISNGTDTHLFLVDTAVNGVGGKTASDILEKAGIVTNKNIIPYDVRKPSDPSGIRIGTAALTTRGAKEKDMKQIARLMNGILSGGIKTTTVEKEVRSIISHFSFFL